MVGMQGFHHMQQRRTGVADPEPFPRFNYSRSFVSQRLQQPQNSVSVHRRSDKNRADLTRTGFRDQIVKHLIRGRFDFVKQLLHQGIVVIRKRLEHGKSRFDLPSPFVVGDRHRLTFGMFPVNMRPLQRQVDKTGRDPVLPDRYLPEDQRHL